ncbi:ankyrin repeat domain-containing protein 13C-A [Vigna radiata var. radiata]|uniref:Ankyrin repeat domain-containing protein 13C-A n=1 Tax=Vigna radiata var. radiata TaxID=3916 RepID=A0A1S3VG18_VIGRR|nr:ankyrin repeat domain-containing protein 13C-A [Vigna radiata var. radiata]
MAKSTKDPTSYPPIKAEQYLHSPVHYAVVIRDHAKLSRIISSLPRVPDPARVITESDSLAHERLAEKISAVLDRRDVPFRETPLHLAVRLNDIVAAKSLATAGADISLHNGAGWNPLQEAICRRASDIAHLLARLHHHAAWAKWRRRLPRLVAALRRMRDFYMEISFHFESSVIPFVGKIAPSDTYKIWKRDGNLRADTTLAGFDGLKIHRADQSFLFLGDGDGKGNIPAGSLLVLNRDDRKILDAFENAGAPMSDSDAAGFCSQSSVYRPGMDVTKAELVGRTNWRRQEKMENVGEWKARVYEVHNVVFSFRSRKVAAGESDVAGSEQVLPLELDEDEDGFLVAENPSFGIPAACNSNADKRRHSSFVREEREWVPVGRKSVDLPSISVAPPRKSSAMVPPRKSSAVAPPMLEPPTKEKEYLRSLRPAVWLTEQFPLKTEELLPLLDILANKVKAVRRLRELLTTKFPAGSFPVKVAIPVVPTVRVVVTFTKFVDLQPLEQFYTPLSSPSHLLSADDDFLDGDHNRQKLLRQSSSSSGGSTWLRRSTSSNQSWSKHQQRCSSGAQDSDPFAIPSGYTWTNSGDDSSRKMNKSNSFRKSK